MSWRALRHRNRKKIIGRAILKYLDWLGPVQMSFGALRHSNGKRIVMSYKAVQHSNGEGIDSGASQ
eukprot:4562958-Pyramimonas_sp.AAC.1